MQRFFDRSVGTPAVAREMLAAAQSPWSLAHYCERFTAPPWKGDGPALVYSERLCEQIKSLASSVIVDEASTREHFEQLSTVLSIKENIRTQRRMERLTYIALFVATMSLVAALPDDWVSTLREWRASVALMLRGVDL